MDAAHESVKMLSPPSRILFVMGIAEEADDSNMYAIICNSTFHSNVSLVQQIEGYQLCYLD